jgi:hypothetical protein
LHFAKRTAMTAGNDFFQGGQTAMATNHDIYELIFLL